MIRTASEDKALRTGISPRNWINVICAVISALSACAPPPEPPAEVPPSGFALTRVEFSELTGWAEGGQDQALAAFRRSCARITQMAPDQALTGSGYAGQAGDWLGVCQEADETPLTDDAARAYFERAFLPYRVSEGARLEGLFTGYFEPELAGSTSRHGPFQTPLYGLPPDLVSIDLGAFRDDLEGQRIAGRLEGNRLVPYPARAEISRNGITGLEPLLYIDKAADAFFLQIQGSGRVRLDDGSVVRASYAGQNGHPYTAIGAVLINRGELTRETVSMQSIRAWLDAHPDQAQELYDQNASYVFFSVQPLGDPSLGAAGTQGAPLTAGASIAVDDAFHALGAPVWLETTLPAEDAPEMPFRRLLIAQDTGGAINGPIRGDIYWGVGAAAGEIAGRMRSTGTMGVLLPRAFAEQTGLNFRTGSAE